MSKTIRDARCLSAEAQESLRVRAVDAVVKEEKSQGEVAQLFGVSRYSINKWVGKFRANGNRSLKSRKRGRPKGKSSLTAAQASSIVNTIRDRCPDQVKLPFALWTREGVAQLIYRRFNIDLSVWTVGRLLKRWGFTPQKPLRRAYERNPLAVEKWLAEDYPRIRREAARQWAEVHWGDEMGVRSDHQAGRSYAPRGVTPVVLGTGQRFGFNVVSSITNRGKLRFMVFDGKFTADVFIEFLKRLTKDAGTVFLIVDRHPVHRASKVRRWLQEHKHYIRLFFLPAYSPDLNPDEYLNNDVKTNAVGRKRARDKDELKANVRSYLASTQKKPNKVRLYFHAGTVRYAS